jgi:hypothetical protein
MLSVCLWISLLSVFWMPESNFMKLGYIVAYRPVARHRPARNSGSTVESGVSCVVRPGAISLDWPSSVQLVQCNGTSWLVSESVRGLLRLNPCELLLLEAGSWGTGILRKPRIRGTSAVGSRYQATADEVTDWEDLVRALVNGRVCVNSDSPILTCSYVM